MASRKLSINLLSQNSAGAEHILNVASNFAKTAQINFYEEKHPYAIISNYVHFLVRTI
jgi:hypothetical protein